LTLWILAWQAPNGRRRTVLAFCAGLAAAGATLMRPSWLLFTPFAVAVGILGAAFSQSTWQSARDRLPASSVSISPLRRHLWIAPSMLLGLVVAMLPWWIRNEQVIGHFVPTTLQVGASLYDGLNPHATGASDMKAFVPQFTEEARASRGQAPQEPLELRLDRQMRQTATDWAWANPGRALQLAGIKFLRMWNIWPNEPRLAASWPICFGVFFTYTPLVFFAIIGIRRTLGRGWPYILCWLPAIYLTSLHMVFVSSVRYREPAMLALLALAATGVIGIKDWRLGIRVPGRNVGGDGKTR
jgi:hypothetical protein